MITSKIFAVSETYHEKFLASVCMSPGFILLNKHEKHVLLSENREKAQNWKKQEGSKHCTIELIPYRNSNFLKISNSCMPTDFNLFYPTYIFIGILLKIFFAYFSWLCQILSVYGREHQKVVLWNICELCWATVWNNICGIG